MQHHWSEGHFMGCKVELVVGVLSPLYGLLHRAVRACSPQQEIGNGAAHVILGLESVKASFLHTQ